MSSRSLLVTGGAGFIGSHFVELALEQGCNVVALDALTYAGNLDNLKSVEQHPRFHFVQGEIGDRELVVRVLVQYQIETVFNFAAETHVDNSIHNPEAFVVNNVIGTTRLLDACLDYWKATNKPKDFRFVHISTDEVFGELQESDSAFSEVTRYNPNSPYSASKAASDHFVRAWNKTYDLPVITTYCSNNFGPRQHTEKLIPHIIKCALAEAPLPVYGSGQNIRDWLYVKNHCTGILLAAEKGTVGETYCLGGDNQITNLDIVNKLCAILDTLKPRSNGRTYSELISFVQDRPGHDWRYHINFAKATKELGYRPEQDFDALLQETILYYIENRN